MTKKLEGKTAVITGGTRRDWAGYCKTVRRRRCLCLHHRAPPEGTRRGREGNRPTFLAFKEMLPIDVNAHS